MRKLLNRKGFLFALALVGLALGAVACGGDDKDEPVCTDGESRCNGRVVEICTADAWVAGEDCADSSGTCEIIDGAANCVVAGPFDGMEITLDLGDSDLTVDLGELESTTFDGQEAIRLTRVLEQAALEMPWDNQYNFIASDGYDVMNGRYEGDPGPLPFYGELDHGYLLVTA